MEGRGGGGRGGGGGAWKAERQNATSEGNMIMCSLYLKSYVTVIEILR